jgi:hypothetical protein
MGGCYYPATASTGYPAGTVGVPPYTAGLQQSYLNTPASVAPFVATNSFNMPPAMQNFNSAGYFGYGAAMVEPFPYNSHMGMQDPYVAAYADRINSASAYGVQDFEDPMSSFRTPYTSYGGGPQQSGRQQVHDEFDDPRGGLGGRGGARSTAYYDTGRGRYVQQRRRHQACC